MDHNDIAPRLELLAALRDDLESSVKAIVSADEPSLQDCIRRLTNDINVVGVSVKFERRPLSDAERLLALTAKSATKRLQTLIERIGEIRRARLLFIELQSAGGYSE